MTAQLPLRVALVLPYYDPELGDDPARALTAQPTLAEIASAEAARGLTVGAFQLFPRAQTLVHRGARFTFVPSVPPLRQAARWLHRLFPRYQPPYYEPATRLMRHVLPWQPDVVHFFGLTLDLNLMIAAHGARRAAIPLVLHYHGGQPEADPLTRAVRRHNLEAAARVLFTAREQAEPWLASGLLPSPERVVEVMETSTRMSPVPRAQARARTGIRGDPACLMVGRLHPIKDPVTALTGFAIVAERRPLARLYVYHQAPGLRAELEALAGALGLGQRVEFRGRAAREALPAIYSSADVLLQASRREWSGLSVLEAMACGVVPVVTDIPPFRRMTAGGRYGRLFPVGAPRALAAHVLALDPPTRRQQSAAVREQFARALSFPALARDLEAVYAAVARRSGSTTRPR